MVQMCTVHCTGYAYTACTVRACAAIPLLYIYEEKKKKRSREGIEDLLKTRLLCKLELWCDRPIADRAYRVFDLGAGPAKALLLMERLIGYAAHFFCGLSKRCYLFMSQNQC